MAPQFQVHGSLASRAGVYYTSANGGKIMNLGEQHVPLCLSNGVKSIATFQVADVSRPSMSVSKICDADLAAKFDKEKAVVRDAKGRIVCVFRRRGGLYLCKMKLRGPKAKAPFQRQGR